MYFYIIKENVTIKSYDNVKLYTELYQRFSSNKIKGAKCLFLQCFKISAPLVLLLSELIPIS